jgi:hypothetical protein
MNRCRASKSLPNPQLQNANFAGSDGWLSTGTVGFSNQAATLTEAANSQTRLNQVFVVGANDRFLSFTLSDIALDDANAAPDDSFEVALIDANTGASLLAGTGLTRNDASRPARLPGRCMARWC